MVEAQNREKKINKQKEEKGGGGGERGGGQQKDIREENPKNKTPDGFIFAK